MTRLGSFRNIAIVSGSTGASRVLGLIRDVLLYAGLGASVWTSAFILAFSLPNLFRRLLGEGAMTSALVPVLSGVMHREGQGAAFGFFSTVVRQMFLILLILTLGGVLLLRWLTQSADLSERWLLGAQLSVYLLPYLLFICLSAIFSAGLNVMGRFATAAAMPSVLNLCMIGSIGGALLCRQTPEAMVYWLCVGVLIGGAIQLLLPIVNFAGLGWRLNTRATSDAPMKELRSLFVPALAGAAILQINILVSRLLAHGLNESAVSVLYLASRLMELPLGLFTIAVATVFFPMMAEALSRSDTDTFARNFASGMRLVFAISVPAGIGLIILGGPIVELLRFGHFAAADAEIVVGLVALYGAGLPFYSLATFSTRGLHAAKLIRCTVRIAGICLIINLLGSLLMMQFWAEYGLAAANAFAALIQSILLWRALAKNHASLKLSDLLPAFAKVLLSAGIMGLFCAGGLFYINSYGWEGKLHAWVAATLLIPASMLLYFLVLYAFGFDEMQLLTKKIASRWRWNTKD